MDSDPIIYSDSDDDVKDKKDKKKRGKRDKKNEKTNDLAEMLLSPFMAINFKTCLLLFLIFLFVSSNIFYDQFLSNFDDTKASGQLTNKGVVIQGIFLVLFFIVAQMVVEFDLI